MAQRYKNFDRISHKLEYLVTNLLFITFVAMKGWQKIKKILKTGSSPMFILFLVLAFALWYISRLSHNYTTTIEVEVTLTTDYNSTVAVQTPSVMVELLAEGDGRELLLYKLGIGGEITIPTSDLELSPVLSTATPYDYIIEENSMLQALGQYQNDFKVVMITDTIPSVRISEIEEKRVPVVAQFEIQCAPQFIVSSQIKIEPEEVIIKAPRSMLDTLSAVYTAPLKFENLRASTTGVVELQIPQDALGPEEMIRYSIPVAGYVEEKLTLKISSPKETNILALPSNVEVHITMPRESNQILDTKISAHYDPTPQSNDGLVHKVVIKGLPEDVIKWRVEPEFVEIYKIQ